MPISARTRTGIKNGERVLRDVSNYENRAKGLNTSVVPLQQGLIIVVFKSEKKRKESEEREAMKRGKQ